MIFLLEDTIIPKEIDLVALKKFLEIKGFRLAHRNENVSLYQLKLVNDDFIQIRVPEHDRYDDFNLLINEALKRLKTLYKRPLDEILDEIMRLSDKEAVKRTPVRKSISPDLRKEVFLKYNGRCAYCGMELEYKDMQVDHLVPISRGGTDEITNLMPSCRMCNHYKDTFLLEDFRKRLEHVLSVLEKSYAFRVAKRYDLVRTHDKPIKFYFEEKGL